MADQTASLLCSVGTVFQVASTVDVGHSGAPSFSIASCQAAREVAGPSMTILKVVTKVVGSASYIVLIIRCEFGDKGCSNSLAGAGRASTGRLSNRQNSGVDHRTGSQFLR